MIRSGVLRISLAVILALYPFVIYFGLQFLPAGFFGLLLMLVLALRFGFIRAEDRASTLPVFLLFLAYAVATAIVGSQELLLFYPALTNFAMAGLFATTLIKGEPLLLRVVRARGMAMSEHAPAYLYRLTAAWAAFLAINGGVALWTTTRTFEFWALYNGFVSYCLIGLLFGAEFLYRGHYKRRMGIADDQ